MPTSTIPEFVANEIKRAMRRAHTFEAMLDYFANHIGETFTCADLRKMYPDFSSHVAAYWLKDGGKDLGYRIRVNSDDAIIELDDPVMVKNCYHYIPEFNRYMKGTLTITNYRANSYTVMGKI